MCVFVAHIPYTIYHEFQFRFGLSFVAYFLSWLIPRYKTPPDATQWQVTTWLTAQHWQNYLKYARNMPRKRGRERAWNYERYRKREREASEIFGIWRDILIFRWHALGWTSDALGLACSSYIWPVNQFWKSSFVFFSSFSFLISSFISRFTLFCLLLRLPCVISYNTYIVNCLLIYSLCLFFFDVIYCG